MTTYRCEAKLGWVDNPQCENTARIQIFDKKYCHLHASIIAYDHFFKNKYISANSDRCECTCKVQYWWSVAEKKLRETEGWRCKRRAQIKIDGVNMCSSHAKKIALQHLIKDNDLIFALPYDGTYKPLCYV